MPPEMIRLTAAHWRALENQAEAARPEEACGLWGAQAGRVQALYPVENVLHSPVAYRMEPNAQIQAMLAIEAAGWELGIYHSHPGGPAGPSATDIAESYYPEAVYLILAPGPRGRWQGRAFRITAGRVHEIEVQKDDA